MSMFNIFRKSRATLSQPKVDSSDDEEQGVGLDDEEDSPENIKTVEVEVEVGGGKGWPSDASVTFYHKLQGLICVGTQEGVVYAYGESFQFMRSFSSDGEERAVTFLAGLDPDRLLVCFDDNSIVALELPNLVEVGRLYPEWIERENATINTVHVDEPSEKNYVYIGTSEGELEVLEVTDSDGIRVCDFKTTWRTLGVKKSMQVSDIKMCPKDEKYIAVAFDGHLGKEGAVVIFDLSKQKAHRVFEDTGAVKCLAWTHDGEVLYGGTRGGALLHMGLDKSMATSPWNATVELNDGDEEDEEEEDDDDDDDEREYAAKVGIRKLVWFAPQPPSQQGCLFVLLAARGQVDNSDLRSVVVGLSSSTSSSNSSQGGGGGDLEQVFSLPPTDMEKILDFLIIPTIAKSDVNQMHSFLQTGSGDIDEAEEEGDDDDEGGEGTGAHRSDAGPPVPVTPALLLFTQVHEEEEEDDDDGSQYTRVLKAVRCPTVSMTNWILEVGTLADPCHIGEFLPAAKKVTCMSGLVGANSALSLVKALTASINAHDSMIPVLPDPAPLPAVSTGTGTSSKRGGASSGGDDDDDNDDYDDDEEDEGRFVSTHSKDWKLVLAFAEHQAFSGLRSCNRQQDIIIKGYEDGTAVIWGVSMSPEDENQGTSSIWLPLLSLRCGTTKITSISFSEVCGLLVIGDADGVVVVWDICEDGGGMSSTTVLSQIHTQSITAANEGAQDSLEMAQARAAARAAVVAAKASERDDDDDDDDDGDDDGDGGGGHVHTKGKGQKGPAATLDPMEEAAEAMNEEEAAVMFGETEHEQKMRMSSRNAPEYSMYSTYRFNSCREVLRTKLIESAAATLLLPEFRILVVGTDDGDVFVCTDFASGMFSQVENLSRSGAVGSVMGLAYGNFLLTTGFMCAVVYVAYSNGTVCVVELTNLSVVAFSTAFSLKDIALAGEVEDVTGTCPLDICIMNTLYEKLAPPSLRAVTLAMAEESFAAASRAPAGSFDSTVSDHSIGALSSVSSPGTTSSSGGGGSEQGKRRTRKTFFNVITGGGNNDEEETRDIATPPGMPPKYIPPARTPRYLSYVRGKLLVTYDLHRFTRTSSGGGIPGCSGPAMRTKLASNKILIATQFLTFAADEDDEDDEEEDHEPGDKILCAASVDVDGLLVLTSVNQKAPISHCRLFEGVFSDESQLHFGCVLPNGNCYLMNRNSQMLYHSASSIVNSPLRLAYRLPDRALPDVSPLSASLQFKHGREAILRAQRLAIQRRRSSVMKIGSAPFELSKIFSKSRAQLQKEELFGREMSAKAGAQQADSNSSSSSASATNSKAAQAMDTMNATKQAFEERGVRINKALMKSDDIRDGALQYKESVAKQKAELQKRSNRWGLF